jgi:enoyl-CoA hydratase
VLTGRMVSAEEAFGFGLVNRLADDAVAGATELAASLVRNGPIALGLAKEALMRGLDVTLPQGLEIEADLFGLAATTDDAKEGIDSFFGKRDAAFKGQ